VRNILQKELNLLPYKLQVSHKLKPADSQSRLALCNATIGLNLAKMCMSRTNVYNCAVATVERVADFLRIKSKVLY
jgi:hypothetical protein